MDYKQQFPTDFNAHTLEENSNKFDFISEFLEIQKFQPGKTVIVSFFSETLALLEYVLKFKQMKYIKIENNTP